MSSSFFRMGISKYFLFHFLFPKRECLYVFHFHCLSKSISEFQSIIQTQENAPACNQVLFDNHRWCCDTTGKDHPMPHFFNDILSLVKPGTFSHTDCYMTKRRKIQRSLLVEAHDCRTHSFRHSEGCQIPEPDFGCSGLPCTDMSRAGNQLKRDGQTNSVYMAHGKYCETKRVPLIVIECTPDS